MQLVISEIIQHLCFSSLDFATVSCKTFKKNRVFVDTPIVSISSPAPVVEGQSVTIACQSDARPAVTSVMWKKGQNVIQVTDDYRFSGGSVLTPSFTIDPVVWTDVGEYTCWMSNDVGDSSKSVGLQVWCEYLMLLIVIADCIDTVFVACQCLKSHTFAKF